MFGLRLVRIWYVGTDCNFDNRAKYLQNPVFIIYKNMSRAHLWGMGCIPNLRG